MLPIRGPPHHLVVVDGLRIREVSRFHVLDLFRHEFGETIAIATNHKFGSHLGSLVPQRHASFSCILLSAAHHEVRSLQNLLASCSFHRQLVDDDPNLFIKLLALRPRGRGQIGFDFPQLLHLAGPRCTPLRSIRLLLQLHLLLICQLFERLLQPAIDRLLISGSLDLLVDLLGQVILGLQKLRSRGFCACQGFRGSFPWLTLHSFASRCRCRCRLSRSPTAASH
mmetsp:Transcript_148776/g.370706  ORF Transcript_148776/g.370706 Transcript_148776/m.370706 type:complete len:225 (-) Transcript_148776:818-1492(-)